MNIPNLDYNHFSKALNNIEQNISSEYLKTLFIISEGSLFYAYNMYKCDIINLYYKIMKNNRR